MGLFSNLKARVTKTFTGELIADFGTMPIDDSGRELSLSLRRHPGHPPHLQVKLANDQVNFESFKITCSHSWADQLERVAREMRKQLDAPDQRESEPQRPRP